MGPPKSPCRTRGCCWPGSSGLPRAPQRSPQPGGTGEQGPPRSHHLQGRKGPWVPDPPCPFGDLGTPWGLDPRGEEEPGHPGDPSPGMRGTADTPGTLSLRVRGPGTPWALDLHDKGDPDPQGSHGWGSPQAHSPVLAVPPRCGAQASLGWGLWSLQPRALWLPLPPRALHLPHQAPGPTHCPRRGWHGQSPPAPGSSAATAKPSLLVGADPARGSAPLIPTAGLAIASWEIAWHPAWCHQHSDSPGTLAITQPWPWEQVATPCPIPGTGWEELCGPSPGCWWAPGCSGTSQGPL